MPQLDPMIPFDTPKGEGFAFWRTDYSQEHDTLYSVIITATREVWDIPQPQVRGVKNISMGRTDPATPLPILHGKDGPGHTRADLERAREPVRGSPFHRDDWLIWTNQAGNKAEFPPAFDPNGAPLDVSGGPWRLGST